MGGRTLSPAKRIMVTKNHSVRVRKDNPNSRHALPQETKTGTLQFVYTGNARVPCWIVRVPKEIIWGHGGLWSDNSVAMFGALYRMHFPLNAEGVPAPSQPIRVPKAPDTLKLNQDKLR